MDHDSETLEAFIKTIAPEFVPGVRELDRIVRGVEAGFETKISYGLLMYALGSFRRWVCAIGATKKAFQLRFLYGAYMDDPHGLLRVGTSHAAQIDFTSLEDIDPDVVATYVAEAARRHEEFVARATAQ